MSDVRDLMKELPEPDPGGPDRVWSRFRRTRQRQRITRFWPVVPVALAAAAALFLRTGDTPRALELTAEGTQALHWSDQVQLEFAGRGTVSGTDRQAIVNWEQGRIAVQVTPKTGTELEIRTEEGVIRVIGTAFTVTRDRLGVSVDVSHGTVAVDCADGWSGRLTSDTGGHTCLPLRPALLLGRADALADQGAPLATRLLTLDRGVAAADPDSSVHTELLVRRMHTRAASGDRAGALADADAALAGADTGRSVEIRRFASRLSLYASCDAARPYLAPLATTGNAEDAVLLAECTADPAAARALLEQALPQLDGTWKARAKTALTTLEGR